MESTRILIVEDETIVALEIKGRLDSLGYTVIAVVSNGKKAIKKAETERPDLVLMDMRLEGDMDGIEAASIICSRFDIPTIFLTAYLDDEHLERAKLANPYGYLLKPVQERELKVTIEMALHTAKVDREQQKTKKELHQRVKELECFYGISRLAELPEIPLEEMLKQVIQLISKAWQYPEVTHSRIIFKNGNTVLCPHGELTINEKWSQRVDIKVSNEIVGELIVFYSEERPKADEKVFLKEERFLLNSLGERLGTLIERHQVMQELRETQNKLQSIIESSSAIFFAHDTDHQITYLSPQIKNILGYEPEAAKANWTTMATDHPVNKIGFELTQKAIDTGVTQPPYELELRHKSGRNIWCEIRENPILSDGKTISIVGSITDISDKKEAENAIIASEKRLKLILETAPVGIQFSDKRGVITYSNNAHQKMLGMPKEEIIGKTLWTISSNPETIEAEKEKYLKTIETNSDHPTVTINEENIGGRPVDLIINRSSIHNHNNEIEEICTFITDITDYRKIQQALTEHEKKYKTLFELGSDFLALIEIDTGNILEVNQSFLNHYGYTREEALSMKNTDFSAEPEKTKAATQGLKQGVPVRWHKKKDGTTFPVEIVANVFEYKGNKVHIAAIRDISSRIEAEEQIKSSLKEKETLLQEIHHRVKNNLAVITSLINLQSSKSKNSAVKKILRDSQNRLHAMSLVHKFLYQSDNLSNINVKSYLTDLIVMIRESFGPAANHVEIDLVIEDHAINPDLASPIGLVVNELITNSLKYAFPGTQKGQLTITYRVLNSQKIELKVSDDGVGFKDGFDWQQTESLGLNLVKTLVQDQMDGRLTISNEKGTTCVVDIPLK